MKHPIANIIRSFSDVVAYRETSDQIYQDLLKDKVDQALIKRRVSGFKSMGNTDMASNFETIGKLTDKNDFKGAVSYYEKNIIPGLKGGAHQRVIPKGIK